MQLTKESYFQETKGPAPSYSPPLPKKAQRIFTRGRSGKVYKFTSEQIFLYKCRKAAECLATEV